MTIFTVLTRRIARGILYLFLIVATVLSAAPLAWMISTAFKPESEVFSYPPRWLPHAPTLINFHHVLERFAFGRWWLNSIVAALASTLLVLIFDSLAAYAFARMRFRGSGLIYGLVLSMLMVPIQVTIIPLYLFFAQIGLLDTLPSIFLPTVANVTGIFILRQFFRTIPTDLEDAARIDGAGPLQFWWSILLPLSRPALSSVAIITFISSWNNFLWPLVASNSDRSRTLPVGIAQFFGAGTGVSGSAPQFGISMAAALLATLPAVVFFLILQPYFVRAITSSGLKG
ncbi:MAG: carbohydrate ABC transporter permease [Anaerolineae bacterium]|jgi:ABC-type glycerol-3-phosphate transport system permease component